MTLETESKNKKKTWNKYILNYGRNTPNCENANVWDWPNGFSFYHFKFSSTSKTNHHLSCNNEPQTKAKRKHRYHLNTLWSIWYGVLFTYLQGYLILDGAYRFLGKLFLSTFFFLSPLLCCRLSVLLNQTERSRWNC